MLSRSVLCVALGLCVVIYSCTAKPRLDNSNEFIEEEELNCPMGSTWDGDECLFIEQNNNKIDKKHGSPGISAKICAEGFQAIDDKCYHIEMTKKLDWFDAKEKCAEMDGRLVEIESESEMSEIKKLLRSSQEKVQQFWIGDIFDLENLKMSHAKWCSERPESHELTSLAIHKFNRELCMDYTFKFYNLNYICEGKKVNQEDPNPISTITTTTPQPILAESHCPKDFKELGNKCYFIETSEELNWYETDRMCKKMKAKMLTIENANEMKLVRDELIKLNVINLRNYGFWTAGTDLGSEGSFHWQTTGQTMSYTNWYKGEPSNYALNEDCVELRFQYGYLMNDLPCLIKRFYVCETELPTSKVPITTLPKPTGLKGDTCYDLKLFKLNFESQQLFINKLYEDQQCSKNDQL